MFAYFFGIKCSLRAIPNSKNLEQKCNVKKHSSSHFSTINFFNLPSTNRNVPSLLLLFVLKPLPPPTPPTQTPTVADGHILLSSSFKMEFWRRRALECLKKDDRSRLTKKLCSAKSKRLWGRERCREQFRYISGRVPHVRNVTGQYLHIYRKGCAGLCFQYKKKWKAIKAERGIGR